MGGNSHIIPYLKSTLNCIDTYVYFIHFTLLSHLTNWSGVGHGNQRKGKSPLPNPLVNQDHCELAPERALEFLIPGNSIHQFPCLPEKAETILLKGLK